MSQGLLTKPTVLCPPFSYDSGFGVILFHLEEFDYNYNVIAILLSLFIGSVYISHAAVATG